MERETPVLPIPHRHRQLAHRSPGDHAGHRKLLEQPAFVRKLYPQEICSRLYRPDAHRHSGGHCGVRVRFGAVRHRVGDLLAYLNNRTDIPFKFLFKIVSVMPMMIPHVLFAVSWALLLNPTNGILNMWLTRLFALPKAPFNIYTIPGMIVVEGLLDLLCCLSDHLTGDGIV